MKRVVCLATAILLVVFLLVGTAVNVFAESVNLSFTVHISDNPVGSAQGIYVDFYVKGVDDGVSMTYGPYHNNASSVLTAEFFSVMTLEGHSIPAELGYTGCLIRVLDHTNGTDITRNILSLEPINGEYYADFNQDVTLTNVNGGRQIDFIISAVNMPQHISNVSGYDAGYDDGLADGYERCMDQKVAPLQEQYDILYEAYQDALEAAGMDSGDQISAATFQAALAASRQQGYNDGVRASDVVPKLVAGSIASTGNVITDFLKFEVFGVRIYVILALVIIIPVAFALTKLFMKHG